MTDTFCAPQSFADVVNLWKPNQALADELGVDGIKVRKWRERDSIPPEHWPKVIKAAEKIGQKLTAEELTALAVKRAKAPKRSKKAS